MRTGKPILHLTKGLLISSRSPDKDKLPTQRDSQLEFYRNYQKVAEEYDRKFLKNRKEDLDTLLIFVSSTEVLRFLS